MAQVQEHPVIDFPLYPPVGDEDWRYTFASAKVRALESEMISRTLFMDMANAADFSQAVDLISPTEYALPQGQKNIEQLELILQTTRSQLRALFTDLMVDEPIVTLLRAREDFANMRLALRRKLTDRPLGIDYSDDGSVPAEQFEQIFEEENYSTLPMYMQTAIEAAVLTYYQNKNIRDIDFTLDASHAKYKIDKAIELDSIFLAGRFRIQIDLINIRTMLRLKFTESDLRNVFIPGGFVEFHSLKHCLELEYDAIPTLFYATPYYDLIESGVRYLAAKKSFLKIECNCQHYMEGFLKSTSQITAGPQPVIAYLLLKEAEIRNLRFVLTAKWNDLDKNLILDRLGR